MMGFPRGGFSLESAATAEAYNTNASMFRNNLVHANADPYRVDATAATVLTAAQLRTKAEAEGNITVSDPANILEMPFNWDTPNFMPKAGSPALTNAAVFTGLDNTFFTTVTHRGALGTTNWLAGWVSYTPQTNSYQ
jgi:hypothetical protein